MVNPWKSQVQNEEGHKAATYHSAHTPRAAMRARKKPSTTPQTRHRHRNGRHSCPTGPGGQPSWCCADREVTAVRHASGEGRQREPTDPDSTNSEKGRTMAMTRRPSGFSRRRAFRSMSAGRSQRSMRFIKLQTTHPQSTGGSHGGGRAGTPHLTTSKEALLGNTDGPMVAVSTVLRPPPTREQKAGQFAPGRVGTVTSVGVLVAAAAQPAAHRPGHLRGCHGVEQGLHARCDAPVTRTYVQQCGCGTTRTNHTHREGGRGWPRSHTWRTSWHRSNAGKQRPDLLRG